MFKDSCEDSTGDVAGIGPTSFIAPRISEAPMIDRPRIVAASRPPRRRDARKVGQSRRPTIEALEVRSLLSTAGTPDFSYAVGSLTPGQAIVNFQGSGYGAPIAQALLSNGDDVVVGTQDTDVQLDDIDAAVTQLNPDGTPDTTFGTSGTVTLSGGTSGFTFADAVAIQSNGDIVVAADFAPASGAGFVRDIELFMLNPDGSLDTSFGTAGVVQFSFMQGTTAEYSSATTLAIAPDGDIVVGGYTTTTPGNSNNDQPAIAAFTASGTPDTTFGTNGQVLLSFTGTDLSPNPDAPGVAGLAIQSSGAIDFDATVEPTSTTGTVAENEIAVGQLTASGAFDTTFGTGGQVVLSGSTYDNAGPLAIQSNGQLIVTGGYYYPGDGMDLSIATSHFDVYRLNTDGSPDTTFGTMGEATPETSSDLPYGANDYDGDEAQSVLVEPGGTILVGGVAASLGEAGATIVALNADGSPDESFGTGGLDVLPAAYSGAFDPSVHGLALQSNGQIVALTGQGVTRLLTSGADNDFDDDGTSDPAVLLTNLDAPVFAYQPSSTSSGSLATFDAIGIPGAGQTLPAPGAYDGAGIDELGVYLPSIGAFAIKPFNDTSDNGAGDVIEYIGPTGVGNAIPAPADYTGSGHTDIGVYDTATGSFIYSPQSSTTATIAFGIPGAGQSIPVPADYYGTGQDDIAVYLAASGVWAIKDPTGNTPGEEIAFGPAGIGNAIPAPADYDNSGHIELGLYLPSIGAFAYLPYNGGPAVITAFGMPGAGNSIPMPGDYDGSGHTELAVYMPSIDAFAYRPYDGGPDVIEAFGAVGNSIPFSAAGAQAFAGTGGGGGSGDGIAPKAMVGGLDGYVDFVPDLAGQPKKAASGGSWATTTTSQS
jgi:uncharacterized delta-60 repeat protein